MPKSNVPDEVRKAYIDNYLKSRGEGQIIDDLYWDGQYYFADNKGAKHGGWRLRNRGSHSAQGSKRRAQMRGATATKDMYINAFGEQTGTERYNADRAELKRIWGTRGTKGMDIDHIYPLAAGGVEHPTNLMMRESSANRSKGAKPPTPAQRTALMLADTPEEQIKVQGPKPTPAQRSQILGLSSSKTLGTIQLQRKAAMTAAATGAVAPAFLGTAASASELQTRTQIAEQTQNPIDRLQQGIAGTSLALDAASYVPVAAVPAGIASAALDVTNLAIDTGREFIDFLGSIRLHRK